VRELLTGLGFTVHLPSRSEEQPDIHARGLCSLRQVFKRTDRWMNRFHGLLVRWARKAYYCVAFVHLGCGILIGRAKIHDACIQMKRDKRYSFPHDVCLRGSQERPEF
jgi:hypothetical protein